MSREQTEVLENHVRSFEDLEQSLLLWIYGSQGSVQRSLFTVQTHFSSLISYQILSQKYILLRISSLSWGFLRFLLNQEGVGGLVKGPQGLQVPGGSNLFQVIDQNSTFWNQRGYKIEGKRMLVTKKGNVLPIQKNWSGEVFLTGMV